MKSLAFVLSGLAAGVFSGSMGVGGALLATPLIRFLGVTPYLAIGTTVPVLLPTTITGALTYRRSGLVDRRIAAWTALGGALAAAAGAFSTRSFNGHLLMLGTAGVLFVLAARTLPEPRDSQEAPLPPRRSPAGLLALGAVAGFFSGLLGIGGGFIMVPAFIRLFRLPIKVALGTSLAVISVTAVPNVIAQALVGNVDWGVAGLLAGGVIPGAWVGARLAIGASDRVLRIAVAVAVMAVGVLYAGVEITALFSG